MSEAGSAKNQEIGLYIQQAHRMLRVASLNLAEGFLASAINRAYYAIFYAANALLVTQGLTRGKHSGVIAAFRRQFVKAGHIEIEYGEIYGRVMDDRHISDYDIEATIEPERAETDLDDARRFVDRAVRFLQEGGWL